MSCLRYCWTQWQSLCARRYCQTMAEKTPMMGGEATKRPDVTSQKQNGSCRFSENALVWFLCGLYVIGYVTVVVTLPVYASGTKMVGAGPYVMTLQVSVAVSLMLCTFALLYKCLWSPSTSLIPASPWRVLCFGGALYALAGIGSCTSSLPERTPSYLQGILVTLRIPYVVIVRLLWLRKGLSARRAVCTVILLVGIFITLQPQIWDLMGSRDHSLQQSRQVEVSSTAASQILWPALFGLSYLPLAVIAVLCERELKDKEAQSLVFFMWIMLFQSFTIVLLFWVDLLPFFGTSTSVAEVVNGIKQEMICLFSTDAPCRGLALKGWVFIAAFCLANLFQVVLIQRAEGAVFAMVVQSMVTPLATIFWTLFQFDEVSNGLYWRPLFTVTTAFTVGGLLVVVPAVVMYNVFSGRDARLESPAAAAAAAATQENGHVLRDLANYKSVELSKSG